MKQIIILVAVAVVLIGVVVFLYSKDAAEMSVSTPTPTPVLTDVPGQAGFIREISYDDNGFHPDVVTIRVGEELRFFNQSNQLLMWPASAVHPTHKAYPGSGIEKCGTAEKDSLFDACSGLNQGESFTFTFNQLGTWSYHDHLNSGLRGIIIVK